MSLVITPSGASAITFSDLTSAFYSNTGKYWQTTPNVHPFKFRVSTQPAPTAGGRFTKRFGFDTRTIDRIIVHYVNTSIANVLAAYKADEGSCINVANVLTLPGWANTFPACECVEFRLMVSRRGLMVQKIGSLYRAQCSLVFEQLRAT